MREVINLSLPSEMAKIVKKAVKSGHYASTSEFFRTLLRNWMEEKLYQEIAESESEFVAGKSKPLKSLNNLR